MEIEEDKRLFLIFAKNFVMKKLFRVIIVLVILAIVMKGTCPKPEKHYEAATVKLTELLNQNISEYADAKEIIEELGIDSKETIGFLVKNMLYFDDYFVCNVGKFVYDGKAYPLTVGLFNHVFVLTDYIDEIQKAEEMIGNYKSKFE